MRRTIVALFVCLLSSSTVQAVDITTCGEVIGHGETGVLVDDLTCVLPDHGVCEVDGVTSCSRSLNCPSGVCLGVAAVVLERNATLDLNGFNIESTLGVECADHRCEIRNGLIAGTASPVYTGIWGNEARIELADLQIVGDGGDGTGVTNVGGKIYAKNLTIQGTYFGMNTRHLRGENINVSNNDSYGLYISRTTKVNDLTANGNGLGNAVGNFKGSNVVANGNGGDALVAGKFRGTNIEVSNNAGSGIWTYRSARINGLTALENDGPGYKSEKGGGVLTDATITSTLSTYDIETPRRTVLRGTSSCDQSLNTSTGGNWGICTLD